MIYNAKVEAMIVAAIEADPAKAVVLPDHAYAKDGRVVVLVDGLSIDLHRHLHNLLIRPLAPHERMWQAGGDRNVNPHLFTVVAGRKSPNTQCPNGHDYAGNEAPPNSRGYRCRICLVASQRRANGSKPRIRKTHCPQNHEYTRKNTIKGKDGKRRCRTCRNARNAAYQRRRRNGDAS